VCVTVLLECAGNCLSCNSNGAGKCDECRNNYKLHDTWKNCSRQSLFLSQYILELLVLSFVAIFVLLGPYMGSVGHYQQYHQTAVLDSRDIGLRRVNEHRAHWVKGIPSSRQSIICLRITHSSCSPIHSVQWMLEAYNLRKRYSYLVILR